jgi:hypothetical protein
MERTLSYLKPEWFADHFGSDQISLPLIGKIAAVGILLAVISDIPASWDVAYYFARILVVVAIIAVVLLPVRAALTLLLILLVVGRDFDTEATASMWQLDVGPIRPSWIVFSLLAAQLFKLRDSIVIPKYLMYAIGWFAIVPLVAGLLYGGITDDHAIQQWVIDLKFPMMLFGVLILFISYLRANPSRIGNVAAALVGALIARHLLDLFDFFAGFGPELDVGISRVSEDSAKAGVAFFLFLGLILIANSRDKIPWGLLIAIPALTLIAAYGTRMIWIEFVASIPILVAVVRIRRALIVLAATVVVIVAGSGALYIVNKASAERVYDRFQYITEGRSEADFPVEVEYNLISRIDPIRYAEFLNVFDSMNDQKSWLWGSGYGGYYNDNKVDFPPDLMSTFQQHSLDSGKFYRTHNFFTHFFHKYGLIGLVLTIMLWVIPGYALIRVLRDHNGENGSSREMLHLTMLALSVLLLTSMIEMTWSGKGFFINGVLISLSVSYVVRQSRYVGSSWLKEVSILRKSNY